MWNSVLAIRLTILQLANWALVKIQHTASVPEKDITPYNDAGREPITGSQPCCD